MDSPKSTCGKALPMRGLTSKNKRMFHHYSKELGMKNRQKKLMLFC